MKVSKKNKWIIINIGNLMGSPMKGEVGVISV
jgi:hypothetical protein